MQIEQQTQTVRTSSLGWMIQRISGRLDRTMTENLAPHRLSIQQFAVMMTVLEVDGLSQTEIGKNFGMPAYAISRAIDHLESENLLERRAHPTSRRTHTIHPTETARALSQTLFGIVEKVNAELVAGLSGKQRKDLRDILEQVLGAEPQRPPP